MKPKLLIFLLILILMGVYWIWWLSGPRVANDLSLTSQNSMSSLMDFPQTWSVNGAEGLGEYTVFTLWSWSFNFLFGFFSNLGLSFSILERVLFIIPFLSIGTLGIWKICGFCKLSNFAKFVSIIFYLTNTYILLVIDGGQLSISMVYAFFPISFLAIEKSLHTGFKKKIVAGLLSAVICIFDIRFIYILFLLCLIRFLYELIFLNPKKWIWWVLVWVKTGIVISLVLLGLNAFWIVIILKSPLPASFYAYLTQTSFVSFISLGHAVLMLSPHWFKNVFGNLSPLKFEFIFIPLLVFLAPILKPRNKLVGFWVLIAVLSIFLAKGSSEPLSAVYPWLYSNIPGFSLFRDSSKFFFLIALSYAILLAITIDEITKRLKNYKLRAAFILSIIVYLLFLIRPVWLGKMTGTFSIPAFQSEYSQLDKLLTYDKQESNVFWIPTISSLTNLNTQHPSLEAARLAQIRPFTTGTVGTYEIFNYLREASFMGQIFDVANIGYIVYPPLDLKRENDPDKIKYYYTFLNQLSNLSWLKPVDDSAIPLLRVTKHQNKFFITPNSWWVIGSDDIYNEATKSNKLSLSKNALVFAEESTDLSQRLSELPNTKIVLNNKTMLDLAAGFINKSDLIFPAKEMSSSPNKDGWWKREGSDLIKWRDFLQFKFGIDNQDFDLGGGWAVAEGERQFTILPVGRQVYNLQFTKGKTLLARVMESSRSGNLRFYQGEDLIGEIDTKSLNTNVKWFEVGSVGQNNQSIKIKTQGDINVINALAIISLVKWQEYKDIALNYDKQNRIIDFASSEADEYLLTMSYKQVSATKYIINISNLKKPEMLIFSQNFNSNWKLNGKSPFPVYSLLNGYNISSNGQYELSFVPQKYVPIGLVISITTLLILLILLLV